jgi:hypothetical protein
VVGALPGANRFINLGRVLENVVLLLHGGFAWVFAGLLLCADCRGSIQPWGCTINELNRQSDQKGCLVGFLCLLTVPVLMVLVSGVALCSFATSTKASENFDGICGTCWCCCSI